MERRLTLHLPRVPTSAEIARHALDAYRTLLPPSALGDLKLVITELVSNSVRHGVGDQVVVEIALLDDGDLTGQVNDEGGGFAIPAPPADEHANHGRGLPIVGALVDAWGVEQANTHVWFRMPGAGAGLAD